MLISWSTRNAQIQCKIDNTSGWLVAVAAPGVMLNNVSVRCQTSHQLTLNTHKGS